MGAADVTPSMKDVRTYSWTTQSHCKVTAGCVVGADGKGKKKAAGPLFQIHWWRVVLDEAQSIKNASTLMAHAAHALQVTTPA